MSLSSSEDTFVPILHIKLWGFFLHLFKVCLSACVFLQAAVKALETAKDLGHKTLEIKTDSKYTINGKDLIHAACWLFRLILFISMDIYHSRRAECIRSHQG